MIKPFINSTRAIAAGALTWRTWTGLVLLPVLVMSLFLWAFWSPETNHGAATAAVVNNDRPVTVDGKTIPLGRELAGNLTHSSSAYTWVLTDACDARNGLASGRYGAIVTIPEDFSATATSATANNPLQARQAELRVQTSNATGVADSLISTQIAQVVLGTLNQQIVQTYLDNVYLSFSNIHDQLDHAARGAAQLADGADKLKSGAAQLTSGSGQLASGLNNAQDQLSSVLGPLRQLPAPPPGTGPKPAPVSQIERLASGLGAAANGTNQLHSGAQQLQDGIGRLSDGAHQLADQLAQGRDKVPTYDQTQRDHLKQVTATPAVALTDRTNVAAAVTAFAVTLALWSCALAIYVITRAVPDTVLTSRERTWAIATRSALPGAAVALVVAAALSLILLPILNITAAQWFQLAGVNALTALTFVALNHALTAIFGRPGRFASIAILVLTLITSLTSTIPAPLRTIGNHLPTHPALLALRSTIIGADVGAGGIIQLIVWLLIATLATVLVLEQRRALDSKQLRRGTRLSGYA